MPIHLPSGDLARAITHEPDSSWTTIEIVAYAIGNNGRKRRLRSFEISADEFFGRSGFGAPMTGDQIINRIDRLRKPPRK